MNYLIENVIQTLLFAATLTLGSYLIWDARIALWVLFSYLAFISLITLWGKLRER